MAVPTPAYLNAPLWSVLREGRESAYAGWFDIDWAADPQHPDTVVMPLLGGSLDEALAAGELTLAHDGGPDHDEIVVRYFEHELPVRADTEDLPLADLVGRQWWRLEGWRAGAVSLNYRRFFEVTSLVAVRVEDREVFDASHALVAEPRRRRVGRRPAHRPPRRSRRPPGLPAPAGRGHRRRLGRRREDPRGRGAAAGRLGVRRDDRLRPAVAAGRAVRRPDGAASP